MPFSSCNDDCVAGIPEVQRQSKQTAVPPTCNSCTPTTQLGGEEQVKESHKEDGERGACGGHLSELAPHRPRENPALQRVGIMHTPLRTLGILLQLVSYKPPTAFLHPPVTQTKTVFSKLTER